jgi:hypothetical protein
LTVQGPILSNSSSKSSTLKFLEMFPTNRLMIV